MLPICRTFVLFVLTVLILGQKVNAQTNRLSLDGGGARGLTGLITNGSVTLTWPVLRGSWEIIEQQPAFKGEWKPVPAENYRTNSFGVSVTLPLPRKTALYRLKPAFGSPVAPVPPMPPMPAPLTNRARPPKSTNQP
jgi:hypothetical protein